jgi:protein SCO1/2
MMSHLKRILPGKLASALLASTVLVAFPLSAQDQGHAHHEPASGHEGQHGDDHAAHRALMESSEKKGAEHLGSLNIPDVDLVDQDGNPIHFRSDLVEGKVVAMNFIFTTCTTICPPMGAHFGQLQKQLGDRLGKDMFLISVSVDPLTDTPERLKAWGKIFGAEPGWTLVTGKKPEVDKLLKSLQVFTPDFRDHSPIVLIGDARQGNWTRAYGLAPPEQLAELLEKAASEKGDAP